MFLTPTMQKIDNAFYVFKICNHIVLYEKAKYL